MFVSRETVRVYSVGGFQCLMTVYRVGPFGPSSSYVGLQNRRPILGYSFRDTVQTEYMIKCLYLLFSGIMMPKAIEKTG